MKKFRAETAKNARALKWMGAATLLELGVLALAGVLHFMRPLDRLIWPDAESSILAIDSFRALDTTRIFALKTSSPFELEGELIESIPSSFRLNRIMGGRDAAKLAAIVGVDKVMKRRDFSAPDAQTS